MKLASILEDCGESVFGFLSEANVINADEIRLRVDKMAQKIEHPPSGQWFRSQFFKFLINLPSHVEPVMTPVKRLSKDSPEWARGAKEKGDLYRLSPRRWWKDGALVIKWLNQTKPFKRNDIRMKFETALAAAWKWREKQDLNKYIKAGTKMVIKYPNGNYWVNLGNLICLRDEGERMKSCLQDYDEMSERSKYYSLRNAKGKSFLTLSTAQEKDIENPVLVQIERKMDDPAPEDYEYIYDFIARKRVLMNPMEQQYGGSLEYLEDFGYVAEEAGGGLVFLRKKRKG